MSEDIYAKPDMSKKVRYNRTVQKDKEEWEEREVEIYESTDAIRDDHTDNQSDGGGPDIERHPPAVQRKTFRAAALCLAVLCFLMMTGIILLSVYFTLEKEQMKNEYDQLSNNYSQLQVKVSEILVNNSKLQSSYQTLSINHSQLQDEAKKLKNRTEEKCCPDGWKGFRCSCYFKSKEEKTWSDSRADCKKRGADLVVINIKEEQEFVSELSKDAESWIGLRYDWTQGEWEWVDGSLLTETFWASGLTQYDGYYAACCHQQGKWTQNKNWICEEKMI
ncbi:C-type lectin domain family 12 member B-like [Sander vitreus]